MRQTQFPTFLIKGVRSRTKREYKIDFDLGEEGTL